MPTTPTYPGGYIEEDPSPIRRITGVATSITAFVGRALRGPVGEPVRVQGFDEFGRAFGGLWRESMMSYAVHAFFLNGGSDAVIVRAFNNDPTDAGGVEPDDFSGFVTTFTVPGAADLTLVAANPGAWGDDLEMFVDHDTADPADPTLFNLTVNRLESGVVRASEQFRNLSTVGGDPRNVEQVLEQQSDLVRVSGAIPEQAPDPSLTDGDGNSIPANISSRGGNGGDIDFDRVASPSLEDLRLGIYALNDADLFNLLCIPPFEHDTDVDYDTWTNALAYCRKRRAMLIVDPPAAWKDPSDVQNDDTGMDGDNAQVPARDENAAMYFPRVRMSDPVQSNQLATFAPCGVVAGIFARTDAQRGVWKAPAGKDATLVGVRQLAYRMTDRENGQLNPLGINCLRTFPETGHVVWGARTLKGADRLMSQWKYVPVRRLALFLEESLYRGTQWVLPEPNDESLWAQLRGSVATFMYDLWRQGAFQGTFPHQAYLVKCDRETTTQNDIDQGIVNLLVGFAPLKPAEFVIIKISQVAGEIQT
jgi:uncharacterized protein